MTAALSPDGKFLALLNNGFGSAESNYQQSIAILDLATNQLRDFPDARLAPNAKQSYFVGLAWNDSGTELYASLARSPTLRARSRATQATASPSIALPMEHCRPTAF